MSRRHALIGASKPYLYKEEDAEFYYRQTSGGVLMNNSPLVGSIDRIKGQTIAWNQYLKKGISNNGITITNGNNGTIILNGTTTGSYFNPFVTIFGTLNNALRNCPAGKYLLSVNIVKNTDNLNLRIEALNNRILFVYNTSNFTKSYKAIGTCSNLSAPGGFGLSNFGGTGTVFNNVQIQVSLIYLTLIYGAGNEPSTPEQFEADYFKLFGKPLAYEPYDEGSLRNVQMEGIKSVGFNQWDEEWEVGTYNNNDGQKLDNETTIRCKNKIKVLPYTDYCLRCTGSHTYFYFEYGDDGKYIGVASAITNRVFKTKQNTSFITFRFAATYGTTYNNDICINISDANKNGTYEPYKSETRNFDVTAITGKLNGQGESVVIFPDGMKGVNDVKDEIYIEDGVTKAVKRIGRVDLGSLNWSYYSVGTNNPFGRFCSMGISSLVKRPTSGKSGNILCFKYVTAERTKDKSITLAAYTNYGNVNISDSFYTDVATFKNAMSGVYLDYELAEPQVYVLDTSLPIAYNCEAGGTEQILPENSSTPTSVAPIMNIKYRSGQINNYEL